MVLFFVSILRNIETGVDLKIYIETFLGIAKHPLSLKVFSLYSMEKGFLLLNMIISIFSKNERIFIIVVQFLYLIMVKKFIDKYSKNIWLSYFLFVSLGYYTMSFNIIRQSIAVGVMLLSLESIERRKLKSFLLYLFLAITIHYTAVIFIILYIIYPIKIDYFYNFIFLFIICSTLKFSKNVTKFILMNSTTKYELRYLDIVVSGQGWKLLLLLLIIFLLINIINKFKIKDNKVFYHSLGLAVFFQSLAFGFSTMTRLTLYFVIMLIVLIPNIIVKQKNIFIKQILIIFIVLLSTIYFKINLDKNAGGVVPYLFYWQ